MTPEVVYEKLKLILRYIEDEASKPLENHNCETRLWSKGYRKSHDYNSKLYLEYL